MNVLITLQYNREAGILVLENRLQVRGELNEIRVFHLRARSVNSKFAGDKLQMYDEHLCVVMQLQLPI